MKTSPCAKEIRKPSRRRKVKETVFEQRVRARSCAVIVSFESGVGELPEAYLQTTIDHRYCHSFDLLGDVHEQAWEDIRVGSCPRGIFVEVVFEVRSARMAAEPVEAKKVCCGVFVVGELTESKYHARVEPVEEGRL